MLSQEIKSMCKSYLQENKSILHDTILLNLNKELTNQSWLIHWKTKAAQEEIFGYLKKVDRLYSSIYFKIEYDGYEYCFEMSGSFVYPLNSFEYWTDGSEAETQKEIKEEIETLLSTGVMPIIEKGFYLR